MEGAPARVRSRAPEGTVRIYYGREGRAGTLSEQAFLALVVVAVLCAWAAVARWSWQEDQEEAEARHVVCLIEQWRRSMEPVEENARRVSALVEEFTDRILRLDRELGAARRLAH